MSSYIIINPSDIFTLIMNVYGTLEVSITFIADNSATISSLNSDVSMLAGEIIYYDASELVTSLSPKTVLLNLTNPPTEYTWRGREAQNMFDVCTQAYGILDQQIKLLNDNNLTLTSEVYEQPFVYDSTLISNSSTWNRSTGMGVIFSTGNPDKGSFDSGFEFSSFEYSTDTEG